MRIGRREMLRAPVLGTAAGYFAGSAAAATAAGGQARPVVSLAAFGGKGDGVSDDTVALLAAIESCIESGATLYVPAGSYRHKTLRLNPKLQQGLRIVGDWAYDYEPGVSGSFLKHDGAGPSVEVAGEGGPFYLSVEGVCFIGNARSEAGIRIVGRSTLGFRRCGWLRYSNARSKGALHLTRTSQEFVGVVSIDDCSFAYGARGVVVDRPLTNVINVTNTRFLDVDECIHIEGEGSVRSLNIRDCHFENHRGLRSVIDVDGSVLGLNFTGNYIEQNATDLNEPLINISKRSPGEISRGVLIEGNVFQKVLGAAGSSIIQLHEVQGVSVRANVATSGNQSDRYWCVLSQAVWDAVIELPAAPNGVTPYPIRNLRTGRSYSRTHRSEEDRVVSGLRLRRREAAGGEAIGAASVSYTDRDGEVTVDFDLVFPALDGLRAGHLEIASLPFPNGAVAAPAMIHSVSGIAEGVLPLQGVVAPGAKAVRLMTRTGEGLQVGVHAEGEVRLAGRVVYTRG